MVWQPTATTAIDFNRAWRFRVTAVRVGMFEMIALLAAWMYLPMGLQWSINQIDPTSAFDLEKTPLAGAGIQIAGTLLLLLYVTKVRGHHIAYLGFEKPHWPSDAIFVAVVTAVAGAVYASIIAILAGLIVWQPDLFGAKSIDPVVDVLRRNFGVAHINWQTVLYMALFAPVMEEIWFRGWMYPVVRKHFNAAFSIIAVALIFGFAHGTLPIPVSQIIGGLVFTFAYEKRPTIFVPLVLHMLGNGSLLLSSWLLSL